MSDPERFITRSEAHDIASLAAEEGSGRALRATFALLGVDLDDFEAVQDFRGDLQWIKSGRRLSRGIGTKAGTSMVGVISVGVIVGLWDLAKKLFTGS